MPDKQQQALEQLKQHPSTQLHEYERPKLTLIIPTLNSATSIAWTVRDLEQQDYAQVEVILVDAGSSDQTIDIVRRGFGGHVRVYSVAEYNLYEMYNRGISLAKGDYVGFLQPGDTYIAHDALTHLADTIVEHQYPDLVTSGSLLGDTTHEPRVVMRPLTHELLSEGKQPAPTQACWVRLQVIRRLGKFDSSLRYRGMLDLLCRFQRQAQLTFAQTKRVLVDHDRRHYPPGVLIRRAWETQKLICHYYGRRALLRWWRAQKPWEVVKLWWRAWHPRLIR